MSSSGPQRFQPAGIDPAEVKALAKRVRGPVLTPEDEGYDTERAGYQL